MSIILNLIFHDFQVNRKDKFIVSLKDIRSATDNFSHHNIIGHGALGTTYKGTVTYSIGEAFPEEEIFIAAKRLDIHRGQGEQQFLAQLEILLGYKHENVIGFVGYCKENDESIFVYEYASNKSLDLHLGSRDLTWTKRLEIVIDVASGLEFLHGGVETQETVIHRNINSGNILLNGDWRAKVSDFGLALKMPISQETDYMIDSVVGSLGYLDPLYESTCFLTKESDIYSLGVVLFEILCGRCATDQIFEDRPLPILAKHHFNEGTIKEIVLNTMKEQIVPESLITYYRIAFQCIQREREKRPTISEVIVQLKKALEFQEDYQLWEPKLPKDYKEIIKMSISPEIYSTKKIEDLYNMFSKGILLQQGKVVKHKEIVKLKEVQQVVSYSDLNADQEKVSSLTSVTNGKYHLIVSAEAVVYDSSNMGLFTLKPSAESRFHEVIELLPQQAFGINCMIKSHMLSRDTEYACFLVFKITENCHGLQCPVKVLDLLHQENKEAEAIYLTSPSPWNIHDITRVSKQREDGWMEVNVWQFNSSDEVENDCVPVNLKFISYEGTMSGLIVGGLEFRPM
ncbi:Protein kinase, ATP binding site-containing protein [Artemisia annua]|uniref:Protein kinase, ATP binding site-containing protein n=1 Tax=Artemisia annua TaxID=35608 RepID=A0A2U1N7P0_ARTAN|nr:Protein kinase, ATP binding site-containing protein [Artemisia annua]